MSVFQKLVFLFVVHEITLSAAQTVVSNYDNLWNTNWAGWWTRPYLNFRYYHGTYVKGL